LTATVIPHGQEIPFVGLIFCGAISGTWTSIVLTPIELVKCKMQVPFIASAHATVPPTVASIIRNVWTHQGLSGFWHGQTGTLIRETGGSAAWFGSYEGVKLLFRKRAGRADEDLTVWQRLFAGAVAGMNYNFLFYPADTIKSRMQTEDIFAAGGREKTFWRVGKELWANQGIRGLYRGCGITVARSVPSSALIFTIHDALMKYFS
jgi:ornithine carrier protein